VVINVRNAVTADALGLF